MTLPQSVDILNSKIVLVVKCDPKPYINIVTPLQLSMFMQLALVLDLHLLNKLVSNI